MPNVRALNQKKYHISKHRFMELYHFCMQYNEWKEQLKHIGTLSAVDYSKNGGSSQGTSDTTAKDAIKREELSRKCELIEQTAKEADEDIWQYILMAVTNEMTFNDLKGKGMPCERDTFYDRRRKFYYLLSKKEDINTTLEGQNSW